MERFSRFNKWKKPALIVGGLLLARLLMAQDEAAAAVPATTEAVDAVQHNLDVVWTVVAAVMVFFMQAGFAMVESGFTRAKNAVNIIMKNLMDFVIGSLAFFMVGFGLMFGATNGFFGTTHFFLDGFQGDGSSWLYTFLLFQTVFAATAATIVSGAMAERTKFIGYLLYSAAISIFIYPVFGSWAWGGLLDGGGWLEAGDGGFLANKGLPAFCDFAGSTVVHSVGGWLALAGALTIGARFGKYSPDGRPRAFPGHNITLAALGVFILWFGWFGFNPGSTTTGTADIGRIAITTNLAAAAGALVAMLTAWVLFKKPDASMSLNGALAGLVAITAPCYTVTPMGAIMIGIVAGVLVVLSVLFIDTKLKIDDPVGAVSVHGVCGAWGTLSAGLFNAEHVLGIGDANGGLFYGGGFAQLGTQIIGVLAAFVWAFGLGLILFKVLKAVNLLRVSEEDELKGLDITEHGMEAYEGFQIFTSR